MSEAEQEERAEEEPQASDGVEPMPEVVPDDYLDQREYDPSGRPL